MQCPAENCEYETDSNRGLSVHASQKHPNLEYDFTNRKIDKCDYCGEEYKYYPSRRNIGDRENFFCSTECKDSFAAKDGVDTECAECGEEIHIPPSRVDEVDGYKQKNHFCDKSCESAFKSREWQDEDHPSWDGGKENVSCEECGDEYYVKPSEVEKTRFCSRSCQIESKSVDKQKYECANCGDTIYKKGYKVREETTTCSNKCHNEYMSSIRKGKNNPQWEGGRFEYYGPNWQEKRKETLERDGYECQKCGMSREQHYVNYDEDLHIHHKVPRRKIIDENNPTIDEFDVANSLDNLITMCKSCHRESEG